MAGRLTLFEDERGDVASGYCRDCDAKVSSVNGLTVKEILAWAERHTTDAGHRTRVIETRYIVTNFRPAT